MRDVFVLGVGQTPVGEWWERSLRDLAADALQAAVTDAGVDLPQALFVANMLAARISNQTQLGALIASHVGWRGLEATTVEAACASGGVAIQAGVRAIASGMLDLVAVCGVEKMTDATSNPVTTALATAADADFESAHGATFVALNALIMRRYMHEHDIAHEAFAPFSLNAHANAVHNPNAMFRRAISMETWRRAPVISDPVNLFDSSPVADGAAALVLGPAELARASGRAPLRVLASACATDSVDLASRENPIDLYAARLSAQRAYDQAGLGPGDIDVFELHDAFSIMAALSLEAAGFAASGRATQLAADGEIARQGRIPVCSLGGLKGRGHPVGAT
ncbi:MAG: beta-ketoacyl synthase N-terminal-like domain-containing protein, partial [Anaerolineaceae bacterium]|nr:beta-ketoacyl synthase N-terminal-like domain-containing protein [Anaerolineaceae bacterium]